MGKSMLKYANFYFRDNFNLTTTKTTTTNHFLLTLACLSLSLFFLYIFFVSAWGKLLSAEPLTPRPLLQGGNAPPRVVAQWVGKWFSEK